MRCACAGSHLADITLCDYHARVFATRNKRLVDAARGIRSCMNVAGMPKVLLEALDEALVENGSDQPQYAKKAHFLLLRAYDALIWCSGAPDFQKRTGTAHEGWTKGVAPLLEELHEIFRPKEAT